MLTPTEIEQFLEIFECRHLSNAALKLRLSQPTLTQSLARVESKIGLKLFVRSRQGLRPTPAAKELYNRAKGLRDHWDALRTDLKAIQLEVRGNFRIGAHPAVASYCLPPFLRNLEKIAPGIELQMHHESSAKTLERLLAFEVDLAFVVNPVRHPDLVLRKLGEDTIGFFSAGRRLSKEILIADTGLMQSRELLRQCQVKFFPSWKVLHSSSLELIRSLVKNSLGVGILPERIARVDGASLKVYDKKLPTFPDEIFLAFRPDLLESRSGQALAQAARISLE